MGENTSTSKTTPILVQHKKGGYYLVIGEALHTETQEKLVLYTSYNGNDDIIYARPKDMFFDGRFKKITFPLGGKNED